MLTLGSYEKCKQYINLHSKESKTKQEIYPCITFSRQTGSGSYQVSELLMEILQSKTKEPEIPWTYFNKELLNRLLEEFKLPKTFSNYLSEDKYSHISDAVNELLGVGPSEWTIINKTIEIILQLAQYGKAIIVGRGSTVITAKLPNCLNIRLVASLEDRIKHVQELFELSKSDAMDYIKKEDDSRRKHLKSHFFREIDDPTLYHLIINTGRNNYSEAAEIIADTVIKRFPQNFNV